jgi:prepilin-type N-terminal cleavage/methylation domain-containing protein
MKISMKIASHKPSRLHERRSLRGFSLLEMMIVVAIGLTATAIGVMSLQPMFKQGHITEAYNTTLMAIRQARELAVSNQKTYTVSFNKTAILPNTVTITQASTNTLIATYPLPMDTAFDNEPGIPTSGTTPPVTPDGFGVGALPIHFDIGIGAAATSIYFQPDGSGQDINGNINNGVLYIARPGDLYSSRAITVWGATGRIRGWRLYQSGASNAWRQQ